VAGGRTRELADHGVNATEVTLARRFRGYMPVVVDVETGGFNSSTDALLEIAAVLIEMQPDGELKRGGTVWHHVQPFPGGRLDPASLQVTGIDPHHPLRPALPERDALQRVFREVRTAIRASGCKRAILVGHNSSFDLAFLNAAVARSGIKRNPFHPFSSFDTVTLAGVALGQTVLSRALAALALEWDASRAHSALYDAERTADLFCALVNRFRGLYALALPVEESEDEADAAEEADAGEES
jgi:ribonuclease T